MKDFRGGMGPVITWGLRDEVAASAVPFKGPSDLRFALERPTFSSPTSAVRDHGPTYAPYRSPTAGLFASLKESIL